MKKRFSVFLSLMVLLFGAIISAKTVHPMQTFGNDFLAESFVVYNSHLLEPNYARKQDAKKQEKSDSLVVLVHADKAKLIERYGRPFREVVGNVAFLHNNTYLKCDSSLWDIDSNLITAIGNVEIIQENTYLTGNQLDYKISESLAQITGPMVELYDKKGNILRTNKIDYNTRDSIGYFDRGAALKNTGGNIIESIEGNYYGKEKKFSFTNNVQVFTDSTFITADEIDYLTDSEIVVFGESTTGWREDNMLFTNKGTYDRRTDLFTLNKDSYLFAQDQEVWGDTIRYNKLSGKAVIENNAQILDTAQNVILLGDLVIYEPEPYAKAIVTKLPAMAMISVENGVSDTLFMRADTLLYYKKPMFEVDSSLVAAAKERLKLINIDPLIEIDAKAALMDPNKKRDLSPKPIRKPSDKTNKKNLGLDTPLSSQTDSLTNKTILPDTLSKKIGNDSLNLFKGDSLRTVPVEDSLSNLIGKDSLAVMNDNIDSLAVMNGNIDSLAVMESSADSLAIGVNTDSVKTVVKDTSLVTFIDAYHKIKLYRKDMQAVADSLLYTSLDSIARFNVSPVLWNNEKNQICSDSMQVLIVDNALKKVNFLSNAFIATQEDSIHFNQIKSPEMMVYFKNNEMYRFDALGGVSSAFYIQEDSIYTSLNLEESKIMTVSFKNKELQRVRSISDVKCDVKPLYNLPLEEQRLRGFKWLDSLRPKSRAEITLRQVKPSKREELKQTQFPNYPYTGRFFREKRDSIFAYKHRTDSIIAARLAAKLLKNMQKDTVIADSIDSVNIKDSIISVKDSLKMGIKDTLAVVDTTKLSVEERVNKELPVLSDADKANMTKKEIRKYNKKRSKLIKQFNREDKKKKKLLAKEEKRKRKAQRKEERKNKQKNNN